jgi:hypothetical protein
MAAQHGTVDPAERDLATAQLDEIAFTHDGDTWPALRAALVEWHLRTLAVARAEAWIPGLAGPQDPAVEEALARFYRHHIRLAVMRLRAENIALRRRLVDLLECLRFYADGASDSGERAMLMLRRYGALAGERSPIELGPPH